YFGSDWWGTEPLGRRLELGTPGGSRPGIHSYCRLLRSIYVGFLREEESSYRPRRGPCSTDSSAAALWPCRSVTSSNFGCGECHRRPCTRLGRHAALCLRKYLHACGWRRSSATGSLAWIQHRAGLIGTDYLGWPATFRRASPNHEGAGERSDMD